MVVNLRELGRRCKIFRQSMGYTQERVAEDLYVTQSTVSHFESGKNDSARILMWYVAHGFILRIHVEGKGGVVMEDNSYDRV